jgi:dihydroxyacetone synthase
LVNIRTVIGFSSRKADSGPAHGQALGPDEVAYVKETLDFDPSKKFHVPAKVYEYFEGCKEKGAEAQSKWNATMKQYAEKYPELNAEFEARLQGRFAPDGWRDALPSKEKLPSAAQPTRKSSGIAVQALVPQNKSFVAGSADLLESTFVNFAGQVEFQNVSITLISCAHYG